MWRGKGVKSGTEKQGRPEKVGQGGGGGGEYGAAKRKRRGSNLEYSFRYGGGKRMEHCKARGERAEKYL